MKRNSSVDTDKLLNLLARTTEELGTSLDFDETVSRACEIPLPLLGDWSALFLVDGPDEHLSFVGSSHRVSELQSKVHEYFKGCDRAMLKRLDIAEAIRRGEVISTSGPFEWGHLFDTQQMLSLPLRQRSQVIGTLCLGLSSTRPFVVEDAAIAEDYAQWAARAVENALLYKRTRAAERELLDAKIAADQANQAKSQFLANMSHEIRTPLGAILGFVDMLLESNQREEDRTEWAQRVKDNGQHLLRLINDILNLSKVESGKLELEFQDINFVLLIDMLEASLSPIAKKKNIKLQFELATPIPSKFESDLTRLQQILTNVIGNALKFTEKGSVKVRASFFKETGLIHFEIEDTGPGLTEDQSARLFQPFIQGDVSHTRRYGGTGLGLALSKRLAQMLGGDLELLSSKPGQGSRFLISIQPTISTGASEVKSLDAKPANQFTQAIERRELVKLNGTRVLVVDDTADNRTLVSRYLRFSGAEVITADDGETALNFVRAEPFDIVLMDIQMPGKDGYETTREMRANGFEKPIIALTAHALLSERERCLQAGCDEHLAKPIDREALLRTIAECVRVNKFAERVGQHPS